MSTHPIELEYQHLPSGQWHSIADLGISPSQCTFTMGEQVCVTNSTSLYPVIGTMGVDPCTALILYDRVCKTGAVGHYLDWSQKKLDNMLNLFPKDAVLEAHLAGATDYFHETLDQLPNSKHVILEVLKAHPNVKIVTTDLFPKSRPRDMGIDSGTGLLIAGSRVLRHGEKPGITDTGVMIGQWTPAITLKPAPQLFRELMFDGRMPEHQKSVGLYAATSNRAQWHR